MFTALTHPMHYMVEKNHLKLPRTKKGKEYNGGVYRWWMLESYASSIGIDTSVCTKEDGYVLVYVGLAGCLRDRLHNKHISHAYYPRTGANAAKIAVDSYTSRRVFDGKCNGYTTSSLVESIAALLGCSVVDEQVCVVFDNMKVQYARCNNALETAELELNEISQHVLFLNTKDNNNTLALDFINKLTTKRQYVKLLTINKTFTQEEKQTVEFKNIIKSKNIKKIKLTGIQL